MTRQEAYQEAKSRDRTGHTKHIVVRANKPVLDEMCNVKYELTFVLVLKKYTG